jgi:hypothetical protein
MTTSKRGTAPAAPPAAGAAYTTAERTDAQTPATGHTLLEDTMQSFSRRLSGRPGAPLAIGFGLLSVCAYGPFHQVTCGVDVPVTATQVFEP